MKETKFNFGHGILAVILLFMSGISLLVYKSSKQHVDLVNAGYYEMELKYDEQIAKEVNSQKLGSKANIS